MNWLYVHVLEEGMLESRESENARTGIIIFITKSRQSNSLLTQKDKRNMQ